MSSGSEVPAHLGDALVYFAKAPVPGQVKTRLCPPLRPSEAAGLYAGFLRDVVQPVSGFQAFCYGAPAEQLDQLASWIHPEVELRPQRGEDLWARMTACFDELLAAGHRGVVLRNTDSPDLPSERVLEAAAALQPGRVVLGPDVGGGYYLIGMAEPMPELFVSMRDGVAPEDVARATRAQAAALGLEVVELRVERDIDTFDDLLALWRDRVEGGPD